MMLALPSGAFSEGLWTIGISLNSRALCILAGHLILLAAIDATGCLENLIKKVGLLWLWIPAKTLACVSALSSAILCILNTFKCCDPAMLPNSENRYNYTINKATVSRGIIDSFMRD